MTAVPGRLSLRELTEQAILQQVESVGAVVNGQGDIHYLHGRADWVFSELQTKVADLSRANNDVNNLFASTGIGTVFVEHQLRIQPYRTLDNVIEPGQMYAIATTERMNERIKDRLNDGRAP